jgi:hypothetical protein
MAHPAIGGPAVGLDPSFHEYRNDPPPSLLQATRAGAAILARSPFANPGFETESLRSHFLRLVLPVLDFFDVFALDFPAALLAVFLAGFRDVFFFVGLPAFFLLVGCFAADFLGLAWIANIAPCGSMAMVIQSPPGTSMGPVRTLPPAAGIALVVAWTSLTRM